MDKHGLPRTLVSIEGLYAEDQKGVNPNLEQKGNFLSAPHAHSR